MTPENEIACEVYLWQNDMVMTFGMDGGQVTAKLQGRLSRELMERLGKAATPDTTWFIGHWIASVANKVTVHEWIVEAERRLSPEYLGQKRIREQAVADAYNIPREMLE